MYAPAAATGRYARRSKRFQVAHRPLWETSLGKRWGRRFRLPTLDPSLSGWQAEASAPPTWFFRTLANARMQTDDANRSSGPPRGFAYLCPPPLEPCPLEALPADEDVLVLDEAAEVGEETVLAAVDRAPEYPLEVCAAAE